MHHDDFFNAYGILSPVAFPDWFTSNLSRYNIISITSHSWVDGFCPFDDQGRYYFVQAQFASKAALVVMLVLPLLLCATIALTLFSRHAGGPKSAELGVRVPNGVPLDATRPQAQPAGTFAAATRQVSIKSDMSAIASLLGFSLDAPAEPLNRLAGDIPGLMRVVIDGLHSAGIDESTGKLASYSHLDPEELPVTRTEPMTKEEALTLTKRFLDAVGLDREVEDATVAYASGSGKPAIWNIRFYDRVEGIRCLSGVYINIAAFSDRIVYFREHPFVAPDSLEQKVNAQQAAETAMALAATQRPIPMEVEKEPELLIIRPTNTMSAPSNKSRLCWQVRLRYKSDSQHESEQELPPTKPMFFIDTITGEIIDGSF